MIYNISNKNYSDYNIIEDNRLSARSYFIPFSSRSICDKVDYKQQRQKSDKVKLLSGEWDFKYYSRLADVPQLFDTDKVQFDSIHVPSCWQMLGYEDPMYVNIRYPFPFKPPFVPEKEKIDRIFDLNSKKYIEPQNIYNTTGVYRKTFKIENLSKTYILTFLGVSSCIELYVNGKYVGYGEGSHDTSSFDITNYLLEQDNEILVIVNKWCTGSYLECQDMFRHSGIFRDVLLYINDKNFIYDYDFKITPVNNEGVYEVDLEIDIVNYKDCEIDLSFELNKKIIFCQSMDSIDSGLALKFIDKFIEYNPEKPILYDLYITLKKDGLTLECIHKVVGFKRIEIKNAVLYYNGKNIKIKGVNHHDTSPYGGFTMTYDEMYKDIILMKEFNVNAVRTAHYPPDPLFIEMFDREGLYVIVEADIETHGASILNTFFPSRLSCDKRWQEHYVNRVMRMYYIFKNYPSIFMWSLGNESGGIRNQDYCYDFLKSVSLLPVHYEGACRSRRIGYDVFSYMYPSIKLLKKFSKKFALRSLIKMNKPIFYVNMPTQWGQDRAVLRNIWKYFILKIVI